MQKASPIYKAGHRHRAMLAADAALKAVQGPNTDKGAAAVADIARAIKFAKAAVKDK